MTVIPALEGHEPREFGAMPYTLPLPGKAPEGTWARIECEVWRRWFYRASCSPSTKLF
jgi:hypothetical protein